MGILKHLIVSALESKNELFGLAQFYWVDQVCCVILLYNGQYAGCQQYLFIYLWFCRQDLHYLAAGCVINLHVKFDIEIM